MSKLTGKINRWAKKMDSYYSRVSKEHLSSDLSKAGFKVKKKK